MAGPRDEMQQRLIGVIADGLPVALRPFAEPGANAGMAEDDVLATLRSLKERRAVRRIGARFDPYHLGYHVELGALAVPEERADDVAAALAARPNVTHVFEMDDRYRLWYTLLAPSRTRLELAEAELAALAGASDRYRVLPDELHKATPAFDADGAPEPAAAGPGADARLTLDRDEKALVRLLQGELPLTARPFAELARTLGACGFDVDERWVLDRTRSLAHAGAITTIGPTVRSREEPWRLALAQWRRDAGAAQLVSVIASFGEVLHCFDRRVPGGMAVCAVVEGAGRSEVERAVERIGLAADLEPARITYPLREHARCAMRYFTDGD